MPLVQCPHCGKKISSLAADCPYCNYKLRQDTGSEQNSTYYNEDYDIYASSKTGSGNNASYDSRRSYQSQGSSFGNTSSGNSREDAVSGSASQHRYRVDPDKEDWKYQPKKDSQKNPDDLISPEDRNMKKQVSKPAKESEDAEDAVPVSDNGISYSYRPRSGNAGHRLLGFRHGNPIAMFLMILYYLAATVLILLGFKAVPDYAARGLRVMQVIRTLLGALLLYMPAILFSDTELRRNLPLLKSKDPVQHRLALVITYIPLLILFLLVCLKFRT